MFRYLVAWAFLIVATTLESSGDATVRVGLYGRVGLAQAAVIFVGGILLLGYGVMLNLAPMPFERVVGLYVATLFVVWQIIAFAVFRTLPSLPIIVGGTFIVAGGLIVTLWTLQISN